MIAEHLPAIVKEVKVRLSKADKYESQASDHRLAAAVKLAEARKLVDAGEAGQTTWRAFCTHHFPRRSFRDVKRLTAIGLSDNPEAALQEARSRGREQARRSRGRRHTPMPQINLPQAVKQAAPALAKDDMLDVAQSAFMALDHERQEAFLQWAKFVQDVG